MSLHALRHAPIGAGVVDDRDRIAEVNEAFAKQTGLPSPTLAGLALNEILEPVGETPDDLGLVTSRVRDHAVVTRTVGRGPHAGRRLHLTAWRHEGRLFFIAEPVGEHEEAAANLTEMAALVAHEIRNPLAGIGSALEVIADRMPTGGAERDVITEIRGRLDRLNDQVDDLLLLVRPVRLKKRACELKSVVDTACRQAGINVARDAGTVTLFADPVLLTKALVGLLKYSQGNSPLSLTWTSTDSRVSIRLFGGRLATVRGAAAEQWSVRGREEGLELPVARRIAEAHDGRLDADVSPLGIALRLELRPADADKA